MEDNLDLKLDMYDDSQIEEELIKKLNFPCVVIYGLKLEYEVDFLKGRKGDPSRSINQYAYVNGEFISVGMLELSIDSMLMLRQTNDYDVVLYKSADENVKIDLNNPNTYLNYIKF